MVLIQDYFGIDAKNADFVVCEHFHAFEIRKWESIKSKFATSETSVFSVASSRENLSSEVCEYQRRRPACASAQSDLRLCYSLIGKYNI